MLRTRVSLCTPLVYSDSEHLFLHRACRTTVLQKSLVSAQQQRYITVTHFQKVSSVIPTRINLQDRFVSQRVLMTDPTSAGVRPISSEQLTEIIQAMEIIHSCSWKPFQTQKHSFIWNKGIILLKGKSKNMFSWALIVLNAERRTRILLVSVSKIFPEPCWEF